jgi:hypothetical protein
MPRFHFDMRDGETFTPDEEGEELPSLNAAERVAAETAAEFGRDKLPEGVDRKVTIEVRNEHGQRVLTATVWLEIIRVAPEPLPPKPK